MYKLNPVVKVIGIHALIIGASAAAATVAVDLFKLAKVASQ